MRVLKNVLGSLVAGNLQLAKICKTPSIIKSEGLNGLQNSPIVTKFAESLIIKPIILTVKIRTLQLRTVPSIFYYFFYKKITNEIDLIYFVGNIKLKASKNLICICSKRKHNNSYFYVKTVSTIYGYHGWLIKCLGAII